MLSIYGFTLKARMKSSTSRQMSSLVAVAVCWSSPILVLLCLYKQFRRGAIVRQRFYQIIEIRCAVPCDSSPYLGHLCLWRASGSGREQGVQLVSVLLLSDMHNVGAGPLPTLRAGKKHGPPLSSPVALVRVNNNYQTLSPRGLGRSVGSITTAHEHIKQSSWGLPGW